MTRTGSPALLPLLRSRTQSELLQRFFLQPDRDWSSSELMEEIEVTEGALRRELQRMRQASIIDAQGRGRTILYRADTSSPLFEPLRQLVERSIGVEPQLRALFESIEGVEAAAIYGSWARRDIAAASDVDVLVIGDVRPGDLADRLLDLQERTGREINLVTMTPAELRARLSDGSGFLRDIAAYSLLPLVGSIDLTER